MFLERKKEIFRYPLSLRRNTIYSTSYLQLGIDLQTFIHVLSFATVS